MKDNFLKEKSMGKGNTRARTKHDISDSTLTMHEQELVQSTPTTIKLHTVGNC